MFSDKTLAYGRQATTGLLGVDALYRLDNVDDEEGLITQNLDIAGEFSPEPFDSYAAATEYWTRLKAEASVLEEADRRVYYDQLCHSTLAFIKWRVEGLPFRSQLTDFLHVPAQPASDEELDSLCSQIHDLLNQMGYNGDLVAQCAAWQEKNRVKPDEVLDTLQLLLDESWERTEKYLFEIPAPKSDAMKVVLVSGIPYNAYCKYLDRTILLNTDYIITLPGLKFLAVHEGCPGHYVQFKLRETWYREGTAPADNLLSLVNTANSSTFEGIASAGLKMIHWDDTDDDRVSALMGRYRAGLGTAAAWRLYALNWTQEKVIDWLRSVSLVGDEGWAANRMRFISQPARAALISSYWWGTQVVAPAWESAPMERYSEFLRFLYGRMHSNRTVAMFE